MRRNDQVCPKKRSRSEGKEKGNPGNNRIPFLILHGADRTTLGTRWNAQGRLSDRTFDCSGVPFLARPLEGVAGRRSTSAQDGGFFPSTRSIAGTASSGPRTRMIFELGAFAWTILRMRLNQVVVSSVAGKFTESCPLM